MRIFKSSLANGLTSALLLSLLAFASNIATSESAHSSRNRWVIKRHHHKRVVVDPACVQPFTKTIHSIRVKGHKHLHFDMAEMKAFFNAKVNITSATLYVTVVEEKSRKKGSKESTISLDLNGIQARSFNGWRSCELHSRNDRYKESTYSFKMHGMKLHGTEAMVRAIAR